MHDDDLDLAHFVESLIQLVRDHAIAVCDRSVAGGWRGRSAARWRKLASTPEARTALTELIPDIVDQVLFELMNAVDNEDLPLAWRRTDGTWAPLSDLGKGEMAGRLMGPEGWLESFSQQRYTDRFADLDTEQPEIPNQA